MQIFSSLGEIPSGPGAFNTNDLIIEQRFYPRRVNRRKFAEGVLVGLVWSHGKCIGQAFFFFFFFFFTQARPQSQRGELWGCLVAGQDTLGRPEVSASSCV